MVVSDQIEKFLGLRKTGVSFNITDEFLYERPDKPMKFCEAVIASMDSSLFLNPSDIECLGARRAFGLLSDDKKFASLISEETQIPKDFIENAILEIPHFTKPIRNMLIGDHLDPDLTIALIKPEMITKLIFQYARVNQKKALISPYFFMSVCANIAVQTLLTNTICISFGCPESRKDGRVLKDEVIVGIPGMY